MSAPQADMQSAGASAPQTGAAAVAPAWKSLIEGAWTLPPGGEGYYCVRQMIDDDYFIGRFHATNPPGTHHTFLTMGDASGPDGLTSCKATENHTQIVFGSGPGSDAVQFPEGVALKVDKGKQLLLNLHLFNVGDQPLAGTSGVEIIASEANAATSIAKTTTTSIYDFTILPRQESTALGTCTMTEKTTLFGLTPHMHQMGVHVKVSAQRANGETMLLDVPFDFDKQLFYPIQSVELAAGDRVRYSCAWKNDTDREVTHGESSLDEMCSIGLFVHPATDATRCASK